MNILRSAVALSLVLALPALVASQAPPSAKPSGTLQDIMRGIYFPNSNLIFEVQLHDPDTPAKTGDARGSGTDAYATMYPGWSKVEYAAIALSDGVDLLLTPGRACQNGKPVPIHQADYQKFVREMRTAGLAVLQAARTKNQQRVSDATNDLADACSACHGVYRKGPADGPARCSPPLEK